MDVTVATVTEGDCEVQSYCDVVFVACFRTATSLRSTFRLRVRTDLHLLFLSLTRFYGVVRGERLPSSPSPFLFRNRDETELRLQLDRFLTHFRYFSQQQLSLLPPFSSPLLYSLVLLLPFLFSFFPLMFLLSLPSSFLLPFFSFCLSFHLSPV